MYEIKNLTYQSIRVFIENREYVIPGRNGIIENSISVNSINEDVKNLVIKGLLRYRVIR
jgi:hypothetical protein